MKAAVEPKTLVLYGIGRTKEEALKNAYTLESLDRDVLDYIAFDEFKKRHNDLVFLPITKKALNYLSLYRPPYHLQDPELGVCISGHKIMTISEKSLFCSALYRSV